VSRRSSVGGDEDGDCDPELGHFWLFPLILTETDSVSRRSSVGGDEDGDFDDSGLSSDVDDSVPVSVSNEGFSVDSL
jgi:hypothetical protein